MRAASTILLHLKLRLAHKRNHLTRGRMLYLYGLGMEHKSLSTRAIYIITNDRGI